MSEMSYEERAWRDHEPITYAIYKGISGKQGALRFKLKRAYTDRDKKRKEGCIFLEMAPAVGKNNYDWEGGKVTMALNVTDISRILLYLRNPGHTAFQNEKDDGTLKLVHDPGAGTQNAHKSFKSLMISKPENQYSFWFNINHKSGDESKKASVSVSPEEVIVIGTLLQASLPLILSWTEGEMPRGE